MDNFTGVRDISRGELDYAAVYKMLDSLSNSEYQQNFIVNINLIMLIKAELKYWHDHAVHLEGENSNGS